MGRTIADELIEKGQQRGALASRRQTLLRQLHKRFGNVPEEITRIVESTNNPDQLDEWLDRFVTAQRLEEIGIGPAA